MAKRKHLAGDVVHRFENRLKELMVYAFGFTAALVWVDTIRSFFTDVMGLVWGESFTATLYVALGVTVFAVIVTMLLGKK
jgi:hypothetical protein